MMSDTLLDTEIMEFHKELDARGLNCPLPILKAKKALSELQSGEVLRIMATDPGSVRDFQGQSGRAGELRCTASGRKRRRTPRYGAGRRYRSERSGERPGWRAGLGRRAREIRRKLAGMRGFRPPAP